MIPHSSSLMVLLYHSTCLNFGTQSPSTLFRNLPTKKEAAASATPSPSPSLDSKIQNHRIKLSCILNARVQHEFSKFFVRLQYLFLDALRSFPEERLAYVAPHGDGVRAEGMCLIRKNFIVPGVKTELLYPTIMFRYTRCYLLHRKVILNIEVCSFSAITPSILFHIKLHRNCEPIH